ncbi:ABC transporter permease [Jatrophihabitans lederbergiae]|jgi:peptide/nickel transport system permease protein|uniref:Oligopeptide transport system permease protein OppC n=1 Tax=Jatrophihabitans lederbergiae TaxID=3075547 RepID=A0ABU2J9Z4_9ACTN|nr:ABC transporter permease [Jatrophihabitans sp. DSM 44399]MDT0261797.1 ABC transporter permease [Jatrophihabitans sp. DSM 44399]
MSMSPQEIFEVAPPSVDDPDATTQHIGAPESLSRGKLIFKRFVRQKAGVAAVVVLVVIFLLAYLGPYLSHWKYNDFDQDNILAGPNGSHFFGVDDIGRDVYARTLKGLQKSLIIGLVAALITTAIAAVAGSVAGYFGRYVDIGVVWIIDLLLVLPSFLILAVLSPVLSGHSWLWLVGLLSVFGWMVTGRVVRGMAMSLKEREYVQAAKFMGVGSFTIIRRHLLPNMASLLIVDVTINVGGTILAETGLSFFGFGVQPPDVSLGTVISDSQSLATTYPHVFMFAGLFLVLTVLCVSVIGDALRDAIDPSSGSSKL